MTTRAVVKTTFKTDRSKFEPSRNAAETAAMLGYASAGSLWAAVRDKRAPEPDFLIGGVKLIKKAFWKLSTINKFLKKEGVRDGRRN